MKNSNYLNAFITNKLKEQTCFIPIRHVRKRAPHQEIESSFSTRFETQRYISRTLGFFGAALKKDDELSIFIKPTDSQCVLYRVAKMDTLDTRNANKYLRTKIQHLKVTAIEVLYLQRSQSDNKEAFDEELIFHALSLRSGNVMRLVVDFFKLDFDSNRAQLIADVCLCVHGQLHNHLRHVLKESGYLPLLDSARSPSDVMAEVRDIEPMGQRILDRMAKYPLLAREAYDI